MLCGLVNVHGMPWPYFFYIECVAEQHVQRITPLKSGDHSEVVPLLPIPNRTVKHLSADDSADTCVKVGHRQTPYVVNRTPVLERGGGFALRARKGCMGENE